MPGHKATSFFLSSTTANGEQVVVGCYSSPFDLPDPVHDFRRRTLKRVERMRRRDAFLLQCTMLPSSLLKEEQ